MIEITGFENYFICINGDIISKYTNKPICQWVDNTGYYQVKLKKDKKNYHRRVHRLIAEHFVKNEDIEQFNMVNHKDGNKLNNNVENLEWTNNRINTQHGYDNGLYKSKYRIPILVYTKDGKFYKEFNSIRSACEYLGVNRKTVSNILNDSKKTNNYDYIFKYKDFKN